jgi:hypothetical protein
MVCNHWHGLAVSQIRETNSDDRCERLPVSPRRTNSGDAGLDGTRGLGGLQTPDRGF